MLTIDLALGPDGALGKLLPSYEYRPSQIAMAKHVNRGFLEHVHVMVEAGTGTGKSFGYLVPALLSGQRVVVSTATLALQEQLLRKDIPIVARALGSSARVVQLKGRANYLCRDKLEQLRRRLVLARSDADRMILRWAGTTTDGDRAGLPFVPSAALWSELDTDADDCIMEACEFFGPERCFHMRAREAARHADIVVVNHALFFMDLAMGGGTLIPPYDYAVLDEAHQMDEWATAAFTSSISRPAIGRLIAKLDRAYIFDENLRADVLHAADVFAAALDAGPAGRYAFAANGHAAEAMDPLQRALYRAENWVAQQWWSAARLPMLGEDVLSRRRDLLTGAIAGHTQTIERLRLGGDDWIRWVERADDRRDHIAACAPADVAPILRERLFDQKRCVVMTSATIATAGDFGYLRRQTGLADGRVDELVLESPFDYPRQAILYLPPERLNPKGSGFTRDAVPIIAEILEATRGRAFVLFTSYAAMRDVAAALAPTLGYAYKVQGDMPRGQILEWFRSEPNPVLFATATFWEGVDVIGPALSCVIIDRIPFPPPDDPIVAARSRLLEGAGRDPFAALMVPAAVTRLKQGLGRLIRSGADRGLMCVLDGRLETMRYGSRILSALPPASRVHSLSEIRAFLA